MQTATALSVSVVICAYTEARWEELVAAVQSLRNQRVPPTEMIIVIDHHPALFHRAQAAFPKADVVENHYERGLSGARNSGIERASGQVIAFLDDDAVAAPDWLEQLLAGYAADDVVGVGGAIDPNWQAGQPRWFPEEFLWVVGCSYRGLPEQPSSVRNLIGCNMSFRREVFSSVGYFRNGIGRVDTLPVGCEETELCIRVRQHWPQRELLYRPQARVGHLVPASRGRWAYFVSRCYAEGRSKALVARFVGAADGLASERTYTLRTLPRGVAQGLTDTLWRRDPAGVARAAAIVAGLVCTTAGYLRGSFFRRQQPREKSAGEISAMRESSTL